MSGFKFLEADYDNIKPKYVCAKCKLIARYAVQTVCGHRYCSNCINPELSKGPTKCNNCQTIIKPEEVFPGKLKDLREIERIVLSCTNHGCPWKGELRHRENHQTSCNFTPLSCIHQECGKQVTQEGLTDHLQHECLCREERCIFCEQPIVGDHMKKHLDPTSTNPCNKLSRGCPETGVIHLEDGKSTHLCHVLALDLSRSLKEMMNQSNGTIARLKRICERAITGIDSLVREFEILKDKLQDHETRIKELEERYRHVAGGNLNSKLQHSTRTGNFDSSQEMTLHWVNAVEAKLNVAERHIHKLELKSQNQAEGLRNPTCSHGVVSMNNAEVNNMKAESANNELAVEANCTLEGLSMDLTEINGQMERQVSPDQALHMHNIAISRLEEEINDHEGSSINGVLMWKIRNVAQKRNDAKTGRRVSFYSQCFYTGPHGYKMCARIYLNGDGMGKGTHISLFFVLMRVNYDALLRWPFRQKVTLMLLDQDNEEHIIDAFRPDPGSSSFQKPRMEMNIASGCPLFCSHADLQRHAYIRDDTMFIKIIVDKPDWN